MGDSELDAIRAQRLAQLQQNSGGDAEQARRFEEAKKQQEEFNNSVLSQVLDQKARARLNTIALAKPEKAKQVEGIIIQMARFGQIQSKLSEDEFRQILEKVSEKTQKSTTVKFDRRRAALDSDDED